MIPSLAWEKTTESHSGNVTGPNDQANEMSGQPSAVPTGECVKGPPSGVVSGNFRGAPKGREQQGCRLRLPERKTPSLDDGKHGSCDVKGKTLCRNPSKTIPGFLWLRSIEAIRNRSQSRFGLGGQASCC